MARKNNTIWYIAGGALLLWYLMRRKLPAPTRGAAPMTPEGQRAVASEIAQDIAETVNFIPDETTDRQRYRMSQNYCK